MIRKNLRKLGGLHRRQIQGEFMSSQNETSQGLITIQLSPEALRGALADLLSAADAVIERWHTPLWKDARPTAEYVGALRLAAESARKMLAGVGDGH